MKAFQQKVKNTDAKTKRWRLLNFRLFASKLLSKKKLFYQTKHYLHVNEELSTGIIMTVTSSQMTFLKELFMILPNLAVID